MATLNCQDGLTADDIINAVNENTESRERTGVTKPLSVSLSGDSITDDSYNVNQWTDWGWGAWFRRRLNKRYTLDKNDIFAVASMGTVHLLAVQLPQVLASGTGVNICMIGTNDLGSGVDIIGNLDAYYDALSNNHIKAIALPIMPHDAAAPFSPENAAEASIVNRHLYNRSKTDPNLIFISSLDVITDFTTGYAKDGVLRDGIHTAKIGAKLLGESVADKFNDLFVGGSDIGYAIEGNLYNDVYNVNGNVIANPYMNGTGGTLQNGATGLAADGWEFRRSSPSATFGLAGSKELIDGLDRQVATLSGTGDGNIVTINYPVPSLPSSWVVGDIIEGGMNVEAIGLSGVGYLASSVVCNAKKEFDGAASAANGNYPESVDADFKSRLEITETPTALSLRINIQTLNGEPLSGVIKITNCYLEKVTA